MPFILIFLFEKLMKELSKGMEYNSFKMNCTILTAMTKLLIASGYYDDTVEIVNLDEETNT